MKTVKTLQSILVGSIITFGTHNFVLAATVNKTALHQKQVNKSTPNKAQGGKIKTPDLTQLIYAKTLEQNFLNGTSSLRVGGNSGGGGVGFLCGAKVYLADTYDLIRSGRLDIGQNTKEIPDAIFIPPDIGETLELFLNVGLISRDESEIIYRAIEELEFDSTCPVEITNDDNIQQVPTGCQKIQLASQRNGKVCYNQDFVNRLSLLEQGLLRIHEGYVFAKKRPGEFTTHIRKHIAKVANESTFSHPSRPMLLPMVNSEVVSPKVAAAGRSKVICEDQQNVFDDSSDDTYDNLPMVTKVKVSRNEGVKGFFIVNPELVRDHVREVWSSIEREEETPHDWEIMGLEYDYQVCILNKGRPKFVNIRASNQ